MPEQHTLAYQCVRNALVKFASAINNIVLFQFLYLYVAWSFPFCFENNGGTQILSNTFATINEDAAAEVCFDVFDEYQ